MTSDRLVEHFFRHEYGRLVATLSRRVGAQHLELIEDSVQSSLGRALETWPSKGLPQNPSAWLFRVALNELLGELRKQSRRHSILAKSAAETSPVFEADSQPYLADEISDDLLRMLFVCCDEGIPVKSQLVLALKTLCGFDVREIAGLLFSSPAHVYKRLARARERLRETPHLPPIGNHSAARVPSVQAVLYLLFTEGYLSSHPSLAIRRELCDEAIRLGTLLANHPAGGLPDTCALLALMHLHSARLTARQDDLRGLLLLEEQDRAAWDQRQIAAGLEWLSRSAQGQHFSRYHAEAGVAAEHCLAPSFRDTRWERIVDCYLLLERNSPSPLHRLNRAVAMAEWQGPTAGLDVLEGFSPPPWLLASYHYPAVLADLHRRAGNLEQMECQRKLAIESAPTPAIQEALKRRLHGPANRP